MTDKSKPTLADLGLEAGPDLEIIEDIPSSPPVSRIENFSPPKNPPPNKPNRQQQEPSKNCRFCKSQVHPEAIKCPHCHEWIKKYRPWVGTAAALSTVVPGLGQIYNGNPIGGFLLIVLFGILYPIGIFTIALLIVAIPLHVFVVFHAGNPRIDIDIKIRK